MVSEPYRAAGRTARSAARATYQSAPDSGHAARLRLSGLLEIPHLGRRIAAPELAFRHVQPARISARRLPDVGYHPSQRTRQSVLDHRTAGRKRHRQRQCSLLSHGGAYSAVSLDGDRFRRRRGDLLVAQSAGGRHGGGGVGAARLPAQALGPYARSREGRIGIAASRRRVSGVEACAGSGDAPL